MVTDDRVVREVRVERAVERERIRGGVERAVHLRVVGHVLRGEARDELVDVADALHRPRGWPYLHTND